MPRGRRGAPPDLVPASTLPDLDLRFVEEYLRDPSNPEDVARRAGSKRPGIDGRILMNSARVRGAIAYAQRLRRGRVSLDCDTVLRRWLQVFNADARELVEHWRVPCRRCWGEDHRYHMTDVEFVEATTQHKNFHHAGLHGFPYPNVPESVAFAADQFHEAYRRGKAEIELSVFDRLGGPGYTLNRQPCRGPEWIKFVQENARVSGTPLFGFEANSDHDCPACHGHGEPHTVYHDTRYLSPAAALLYQGIKVTDKGIEVKIREPAAVETLIAKHLGMFVERKVVLVADVTRMAEPELRAELARELAEAERLG